MSENGTEIKNASGINWIINNHDIGAILAFVLISLYMMPIFLVTIAAWETNAFKDSDVILEWFSAFIKSSQSTLNEFHKILLPVISSLSVIALKKPTNAMIGLGLFVLLSFIITLFVAVFFDMRSTQDALSGLPDPINIELCKSFFSRIEETLMMYFMMLVGIGVANKNEG